jgi:hypothetical protein
MMKRYRTTGRRARRVFTFAALAVCTAALVASAQSPAGSDTDAAGAMKVGIVPFADATASGNRAAGADISRTMQAEMVHSTSLVPRVLTLEGSTTAQDLDAEKAVALGRAQHVDRVFVGTVLEAHTDESSKSGWIPSIKGQSAAVRLRRIKATVTLQGELYDVASSRRIFSVRTVGNESAKSVGGTAYTKFGAWGNDNYGTFLDSPLGKALQAALSDMVKKVSAAGSSPAK